MIYFPILLEEASYSIGNKAHLVSRIDGYLTDSLSTIHYGNIS